MSLADFGITEGRVNLVFMFAVAVVFVVMLLSVFLRSIRALSLYDILRKQGNSRAWYSFVPIFSDIALYMAANNKRHGGALGKLIAFLSVVCIILGAMAIVLCGIGASSLIFAADEALSLGKEKIDPSEFNVFGGFLVVFAIFAVCFAVRHILKAVCLKKIYASFGAPAVLYAVLGVIIPFLSPLFLRIVSQKNVTPADNGAYFTEQEM